MNRWLLSLLALACACRQAPPTLKVVGTPAGALSSSRPAVRLVFDRPMAPAGAIGRPVEDGPLRIQPAVVGRGAWVDARAFVFVPDAPLPRSTEFAVEVPAGVRALDGAQLA